MSTESQQIRRIRHLLKSKAAFGNNQESSNGNRLSITTKSIYNNSDSYPYKNEDTVKVNQHKEAKRVESDEMFDIEIEKVKDAFIEKILGRGGSYENVRTSVRKLFRSILPCQYEDYKMNGPQQSIQLDKICLTKEILMDACIMLLPGTRKDIIQAMIERMDRDHDGSITVAEFSSYIESSLEEGEQGGRGSLSSSRRKNSSVSSRNGQTMIDNKNYCSDDGVGGKGINSARTTGYDNNNDNYGDENHNYQNNNTLFDEEGLKMKNELLAFMEATTKPLDRRMLQKKKQHQKVLIKGKIDDSTRLFLFSLKAYLLNQAKTERSRKPAKERLLYSSKDMLILLAKKKLLLTLYKSSGCKRLQDKEVDRFSDSSHPYNSTTSDQFTPPKLTLKEFIRALKSYEKVGATFPNQECLETLWRSSQGDLNFFINDMLYSEKEWETVNHFGFTKAIANPLVRTDPTVDVGPLASSSSFSLNHMGHQLPSPDENDSTEDGEKQGGVTLPERIKYRHCRTMVQPPPYFPQESLERSSALPNIKLRLEHVYGYTCSTINRGTNLYLAQPVVDIKANYYKSLLGNKQSQNQILKQNQEENLGEENSVRTNSQSTCLVYTAAAILVVHDLTTNIQTCLAGHDDDISALAVNQESTLAVTGQMGKSPYLIVWDLVHKKQLGKLGEGFFARTICCITFSPCGKYVAAIGADDRHMMGIFNLKTGSLEAEVGAQNGHPPAINNILWLSNSMETTMDTKMGGKRDGLLLQEIVTIGNSHLKVFSFENVPSSNQEAMLKGWKYYLHSRAGVYGSTTVNGKDRIKTPRMVTCICDMGDGSFATGGDNGYIYIWKKISIRGSRTRSYSVVSSFFAHKSGSVGSIIAERDLITGNMVLISGGDDGNIKKWIYDSKTKSYGASYVKSVIPSDTCDSKNILNQNDNTSIQNPSPFAKSKDPKLKSLPEYFFEINKRKAPIRDLVRLTICVPAKRSNSYPGEQLPLGAGSRRASQQQEGSERQVIPAAAFVVGTRNGKILIVNEFSNSANNNNMRKSSVHSTAAGSSTYGPEGMIVGADGIMELLQGHYKDLYGLAPYPINKAGKGNPTFGTCGEDGLLHLYDAAQKMITKTIVLPGKGRSLHFSPDGQNVAVGFVLGGIAVFNVRTGETIFVDRRLKEQIDEIKYSPNGEFLAVASHDNYIDIYETGNNRRQNINTSLNDCAYRFLRRLKGHTSYVTHIDWSRDSRILQSNCGSYEILYWDIYSGTLMRSTSDSVESSTEYSTWTCVLGFPVMGIWPPHSDGTDINSVDRNVNQTILATGDDFGNVKLFNYPCVVDNAPYLTGKGHSSHVMNVRFIGNRSKNLISVGGHDSAVFQWIVEEMKRDTNA